jgi:hypothetical protein
MLIYAMQNRRETLKLKTKPKLETAPVHFCSQCKNEFPSKFSFKNHACRLTFS